MRGTKAARLGVAGALALSAGVAILAGAAIGAATGPAYADSGPFEVFCAGTPIGAIVLNDATVTGSLSPASPTTGQQFDVQGMQEQVTVPASIVEAAAAIGNTSITGSISATIDAAGASPATMGTGTDAFDVTIPNPVPPAGLTITVPAPSVTVGPFTATGGTVTMSVDPTIHITFDDAGNQLALVCSLYPNDTLPSGTTGQQPPGLPVSPVITSTGQVPPPPPPGLTGAYELYCPGTPVGDLVFNDVTTSASVPSGVTVGQPFHATDYQTHLPLPPGVVTAAAGLSNTSFDGLAATTVDAYGASPDQVASGSMAFAVPIPNPVPASPLDVPIPAAPTSVGPFTAQGPGPVTIAEDGSMLIVARLSDKAFKMTCTAYPNDAIPTSGSTGTVPDAAPILPIIAETTASGTPTSTTTTTLGPPGPPSPATGPFEMYCPGSPVGDMVLNDTTVTASMSPATLTGGQTFQLTGMQAQFSIPQAVAQQAENLGITTVSGDIAMFLFATGVEGYGGFPPPVSVGGSGSGSGGIVIGYPGPYPGPYPGVADMPFTVTLPDPVPAGGVQFSAAVPGGEEPTFVAAGGPIQITVGGINLNLSAFGDTFGLFCNTYPNDSEPTGIATAPPSVEPVEPLVATGSATVVPPPPAPPGAYELFCPGTPIGDVVLNDVTTTGTMSPSSPTAGQSFNLTGYETQVPIPANIVAAASAFGSTLQGSVSTAVDASGATPATVMLGSEGFSMPIPSPPTTMTIVVPAPAGTVGPFTATSSSIALTADAAATVDLSLGGVPLSLQCTAYANDSLPTGITFAPPPGSPIAPTIASTGGTPPPPPVVTGAYELYCPGTPIGSVVINGVTTSGTISPSAPSAGETFSLDGYQNQVVLPQNLVAAASAFATTLDGSATTSVTVSGGTPAAMPTGTSTFSLPIPNPPTAMTLDLPSPASTVGPFTATGGSITVSAGSTTDLTLMVAGNPISLTCHDYADNSLPTGTTLAAPSGSPISPVIATAAATAPGGSGGGSLLPSGPCDAPGCVVTVTGGGFDAGESVDFQLHSNPVDLGSTRADSAGDVSYQVTIPLATAPGSHSITATGATSDVVDTVSITVGTASTDSTTTTSTTTTSTTVASTTSTTAAATTTTPSPTTTAPPTSPGSSGTSTSSGALAFTGLGPMGMWAVLLGAALVLLGIALLLLVDTPRRVVERLSILTGSRSRVHADLRGRSTALGRWLTGR
jgi:hypothetical protein